MSIQSQCEISLGKPALPVDDVVKREREREREENTKRKEPLTPSYINNELRRLIIKIGIVIVERNDRLIEFYFFFSSSRRHVFKFHRGLEKAFEPIIDRRKKNPP